MQTDRWKAAKRLWIIVWEDSWKWAVRQQGVIKEENLLGKLISIFLCTCLTENLTSVQRRLLCILVWEWLQESSSLHFWCWKWVLFCMNKGHETWQMLWLNMVLWVYYSKCVVAKKGGEKGKAVLSSDVPSWCLNLNMFQPCRAKQRRLDVSTLREILSACV